MLEEDLEKLQGIPFSRTLAVQILQENPFIKITHHLFSPDEYLFCDAKGKVRDENNYLFEDWVSTGINRHDGVRQRLGGSWETGWTIKEEK